MRLTDLAIYVMHVVFWGTFGVARLFFHPSNRHPNQSSESLSIAEAKHTVRFSRILVAFHGLGFAVMYSAIGSTVFSRHVPLRCAGHAPIGALVIVAGAALAAWALMYFGSWRLQAALDAGHQLATGGPFRLLRHPLYLALNLLALGSALWVPTTISWVALVLIVIGGDLRARAEESLLKRAFGPVYEAYCAQTPRFLPGIY
jgi:protein-S-isoprenylcysteine O-methyltransferase Ste14